MKLLQEFTKQTNLEKNRIKLTLGIIFPSILYSVMYPFISDVIFMNNIYLYYVALYIFVIGAAYVFMIVFFQCIMKKRRREEPILFKKYFLPLLGVQSILFIVMIGTGVLTAFMQLQGNFKALYILNPLCMLLLILYFPTQLYAFIGIYDGMKHPFKIIWNALKKIIKHYRMCFYSLFSLALCMLIYQIFMEAVFGIKRVFALCMAVQEIVIQSNPFYDVMNFIAQGAWLQVFLSTLYAVFMCILFVYFFMLIIRTYDEDINI